jgi:hypothetical protein
MGCAIELRNLYIFGYRLNIQHTTWYKENKGRRALQKDPGNKHGRQFRKLIFLLHYKHLFTKLACTKPEGNWFVNPLLSLYLPLAAIRVEPERNMKIKIQTL